jgi:hypothetical protein
VSGEALPAVIVPLPLARSNAGLRLASFSAELSVRGSPSFAVPSTATTRSSKKPPASPCTARWCDCSATRSWSARAMFHCFAISSQCSPMLFPVARFFTAGMCSRTSLQRNSPRRSTFSPNERACEKRRMKSERPWRSPICTRLMLSTPPHIATIAPVAEHARGLEHRDHAGGAREHGRERRRGGIELRLHHELARDIAPVQARHHGAPHEEVGTIARRELRGHRLRHGNRQLERVAAAQRAVDARERRAQPANEPRRLGFRCHRALPELRAAAGRSLPARASPDI